MSVRSRTVLLKVTALSLACSFAALAGGHTVLLRDSIGPDNSTTNGNLSFTATTVTGGAWYTTPFEVATTNTVRLKEFRGIGGKFNSLMVLANFDYILRVWTSWAAMQAAPLQGDVANHVFDVPTAGPTLYGMMGAQPIGIHPTFEFVFDLRPFDIIVPANETRVISIEFRSVGGTGVSGTLGWVESTQAGDSDYQYGWDLPAVGGRFVSSSPRSLHDGRLAFEVTAELVNPPCPGDANADGVVNFTDLNIVLSDFGASGPPGSLQGDLDDDGDVDFNDLNTVLSFFGTAC